MPTLTVEDHKALPDLSPEEARAPSNLPEEPSSYRQEPPSLPEDPSIKASSPRRRIVLSLAAIMLTVLAIFILRHPLFTNDGPVHVAFSHIIATHNQPGQPLQSEAYMLDLRLKPNLSVYLLMAALMRVFSPGATESIIQILCIACPFFAGYFALHSINPKNVWLSIFFVPLALNQTLFLGLYNHCLAVAAFFLVIGTYFWMCKAPSYRRALVLAATIVLTFLCHASGLVMALTGLATMSATRAVLSILRDRRIVPALKAQRYTVLALVTPFPLVAAFLAGGGTSLTMYGINFSRRLLDFSKLHLLYVNYWQIDRFSAVAISGLLLTSFFVVAIRTIENRSDMPQARRDQLIGVLVAALVATAVMLAFPDVMGGGWTHYRRFVAYPYIWILFALAFEDFSARAFAAFATVGATTAVMLISSTIYREGTIREQIAPLAQADALIGSHCTVAAIPLEPNLLDEHQNFKWLEYQPFYQSASRLELHDDRVVLFNYLARLAPYPVHFRPNIEPQALLYRWKPMQLDNQVQKVDVQGFEARSAMRVDYILLWGRPERSLPPVRAQVLNALTQFDQIYESSGGVVKLYERRGVHNALCTANPHN